MIQFFGYIKNVGAYVSCRSSFTVQSRGSNFRAKNLSVSNAF